jgi:hypothetical protein
MWQRKLRISMMIGILGLGLAALLVGVSTQTSAQSTVTLVDANTEAVLLQAGEFSSVAQNCNLVCPDLGTCPGSEISVPCGGAGSNCFCQHCGPNWDCYPPNP